MSAVGGHLAIAPNRCDGCGRCVRACHKGAVRVGGGYVYVDNSACDGCFACVESCDTGAIVRRSAATHVKAVAGGAGSPTVVVGSRAEAKAFRKATEQSVRERSRATKSAQRATGANAKKAEHAQAMSADGTASFTIADAGTVLVVMMVAFLGKELALGSAAFAVMPESGQLLARAGVLSLYYAAQLLALFAIVRRRGLRLTTAFGLRGLSRSVTERASTVFVTVGLLFATRLFSALWGGFAQAVGWTPPARGEITAVFGAGGMGLALTVLLVVLVGPFVEELAFRGVLLRAGGERWGKWPAVLGSAALFSAYHFEAWLIVPTFVLGVALGWLAWSRRSVVPAIALHVAYNGVVVAAAFWLAG